MKPLIAVHQADPGYSLGGLAPDRSLRQRLQRPAFGRKTGIAVAAGAACDRRRSRRETADRGVSG
ncbi:hypothetical protein C4K25_3145 [Pseudomonas chlororaphis]|nr:hypothetical protein C4K25_3145 [Pseudomonas chlororaphis]